jgi:hypothetical protein
VQVEHLKDYGQDFSIFVDVAVPPKRALQSMGSDDHYRPKRNQINPDAAPHPEILPQFNAHNREKL